MSIEVTYESGNKCNKLCPHGMLNSFKHPGVIIVGTGDCMYCKHRLPPTPHNGYVNCSLGDSPAISESKELNIMEFM